MGSEPIEYQVSEAALEGSLHPMTIGVSIARALQQLLPVIAIALVFRIFGRSVDTIELVIAVLGLLRVVGAIVHYLTYRFRVDSAALHIRSGVLFQQKRVIPLSRIQNINIKRDWINQLLGVAEVQVETASGTGSEATLSSLSLPQAQLLRQRLLGQKESSVDAPAAAPANLVYEAGVGRLILAGATRNQAGKIIAVIFGLFFYAQQLMGDEQRFWRRAVRRVPPATLTWTNALAALAALIFLGWIASMVRSVFTFYGFRLEEQNGRLRRTYGLLTRRESIFPTHRLQMLRVESPLIQRKLGLCRVLAETAGSFAEKEEAATSELCPIIERANLNGVVRHVLPGFDLSAVQWRKVSRKTIRRAAIRYCIILSILILGIGYTYRAALWGLAAAPFAAVLFSILRYRALRFGVTHNLVLLRKGVWHRTIAAVPREKIQSTDVTASPLQRRLGLANLGVAVASGAFGGGLTIVDIPTATAVELQNELMRTFGVKAQKHPAVDTTGAVGGGESIP